MSRPSGSLRRNSGLDHFEGRSWTGLHRHRLDDDDGLPSNPSPQSSGAEKKESGDRRHNRACRPSDRPSSISSHDHPRSDVRIVTCGLLHLAMQTCQSSASRVVRRGDGQIVGAPWTRVVATIASTRPGCCGRSFKSRTAPRRDGGPMWMQSGRRWCWSLWRELRERLSWHASAGASLRRRAPDES